MAAGVLQQIGVKPAERGLFGRAALCLLLMGAAAFALLNTAETLFLKRVGVEYLPVTMLVSSGLLVLTTSLAERLASADPSRWLPRVLLGLAVAPLPFVLMVDSQDPLLLGTLVLVSRQILAVGMLAFWLAMVSLVPARRAKSLFAPLASGVTVGAILGSFGSEPLARLLGVDGLIAVCSASLGGSAALGLRLRHRGTRKLERALGSRTRTSVQNRVSVVELLRTSRLFRLLAIALFCGGALSPVLYFEFASVLDAATQGPEGEQHLLRLYSQFRGWLNVAMLASQLWLSGFLYRRIGLPLSVALWPAAYTLGLAWLGLDFALLAAFMTWGAAQVSEDGISDSAIRVLYNLFSDGVRSQATGLLEGPVNRLGGVLGNSFVLGALALGGATWVGWAALPLAALWLASSLVLWRAYPTLLLRASAEHGLAGAGSDRATLLDRATLRSLGAALVDPDPRICRAAVDLAVDGEPSRVVRLLAEAIEHAPASSRPLLVETLQQMVEPAPPGSVQSPEATAAVARSLGAQPPLPAEERADLAQVYARLSAGESSEEAGRESRALLERALGDRAAPVRLAAIAELHRRGTPPPGLPDLDQTLSDALTARDMLIRRAARKELRAMLLTSSPDERWAERLRVLAVHLDQRADRAETAEALREVARRHGHAAQPVAQEALRYLEDRDPRVRGALLCVAGHAGLAEEAPRLVSALGARSPEEAEGAHEGLVALGPTAALPLLVGLEFGGQARREAILSVLRELEVDAATLDGLRARQLEAIQLAVLHRAAVDELPGAASSLLRRRVDEQVAEGLGALLDILGALHEDPRLGDLERQLRRETGEREHDLLLEAVEALLTRDEREAIVPLLERGEWRQRADAAAAALGRSMPSLAGALSELEKSPDATTRLLAARVSLEAGEGIGEALPMPRVMDIAVRLQAAPAFDRLGTQQVMALAEVMQEQKVPQGERVYGIGDEAIGLYFLLEGDVELRRDGVVLEHAVAGSIFGEIASLDGVPHSADAIACADSQVLRLDREDLMPLLEQSPALAIGLAQRLATRIRHLEDQLAEAASAAASTP